MHDNATGSTGCIALASNALRSGIVAAHNACGHPLEGSGVQGSNGIDIFDLKMVPTGLTAEKAAQHGYHPAVVAVNDSQKPAFMPDNHDVTLKIVYDRDSRIILGAQIASRADISMAIHLFSLAIQEHITIDRLALLDLFFLPHFNKPCNYINNAALQAMR